MDDPMKLLGLKVQDKVTHFEGVVVAVSFDVAGCIQGLIVPACDKEGKTRESAWFDTKRLSVLGLPPVMEAPKFDIVAGGEPLPQFPSKPAFR